MNTTTNAATATENEIDMDFDVLAEPSDEKLEGKPEPKVEAKSNDLLAAYMKQVNKFPLLSADETSRLAKLARSGDQRALDKLVNSNLRLVVKIAYEYRAQLKNIMDIIQEGNVGLIEGIRRYDPEHEVKVVSEDGVESSKFVKLSSYAAWWIRAHILRSIINNAKLVKLGTTQNQRKLFFNLEKKRNQLKSMGIEPTDAVLAAHFNVSESEIVEMNVRLGSPEASLDKPVNATDDGGLHETRGDMLPDNNPTPDNAFFDASERAAIRDTVAAYRANLKNDKEIAIIDLRLMSDEPLTLQEIGDKFKVSRERVRQLEERVIKGLREHLIEFA